MERQGEGLELTQLRELGSLIFMEWSNSSDKTHGVILSVNPTG